MAGEEEQEIEYTERILSEILEKTIQWEEDLSLICSKT